MAHEILGNLFFQDRRAPAWHNIMHPDADPNHDYTAREVYGLFGKPRVYTLPVPSLSDENGIPITGSDNYKMIVRAPLPDDPAPLSLGLVTKEYQLVTPYEIVQLWDEHVSRKVQTMMFLRDGKLMVITAKLQQFALKANGASEPVDTYIQVGNWMDGAHASTALLSAVCTVCMNTWRMASSRAQESFTFVHDSSIKPRMGAWFTEVVSRAEYNIPKMQEAAEVLARPRPLSSETIESILATTYPYAVHTPDILRSGEENDKREERVEALNSTIDSRRLTALQLFVGQGTGMNLATRKNTLWGLYQSVVEVEDYRKGARNTNLASSILFGQRAETKDRAFNACMFAATK